MRDAQIRSDVDEFDLAGNRVEPCSQAVANASNCAPVSPYRPLVG